MADSRLQKLALVLVHYSLKLKPGDKLVIEGHAIAAPLIKEVYREAVRAGAHVETEIGLPDLREIFYQEAGDDQLSFVSDLHTFASDYFDAMLSVWAEENTQALSGIDPARLAKRSASQQPISKRFLERIGNGSLRWCGTMFPTAAHAQDAGMSLSNFENFVYGAGLLDENDPVAGWLKVRAEQQRVIDLLSQHDEIHIVAPGTDIRYRTAGRTWINCAGTENFPDGEVFTGPIEDSVNGTVRYTYPAIYHGNEVEDVRLTFRDGKVIESSAGKGQDFLNAMLGMDAGSRTLGEAAFGLNYNIKRFVKDTLFDEKIGGTMHMALGASLPESGGVNESSLHWDMVCDLREGQAYADGKLIYEKGRFLIS
jgi:aminopeptidase